MKVAGETHLDVFAPGHLLKVLLLFQGFVHLVICHTEAAQAGLHRVVHLGEHHELGHVRNTDELSVQLGGKAYSLWDLVAVSKPEPETHTGQIQVRNTHRTEDRYRLETHTRQRTRTGHL